MYRGITYTRMCFDARVVLIIETTPSCLVNFILLLRKKLIGKTTCLKNVSNYSQFQIIMAIRMGKGQDHKFSDVRSS